MSKPITVFIATIAVTAMTLAPVTHAYADDDRRGGWDRPHDDDRHAGKRHGRKRPGGRARDNDDALLLGVLGLAAGAIIAGAILNDPTHNRPPPPRRPRHGPAPGPGWSDLGYYPPAPGGGHRAAGSIEPWTHDWYRYCTRRYRSFNPNTGTFRGYDGKDHFCVARY